MGSHGGEGRVLVANCYLVADLVWGGMSRDGEEDEAKGRLSIAPAVVD